MTAYRISWISVAGEVGKRSFPGTKAGRIRALCYWSELYRSDSNAVSATFLVDGEMITHFSPVGEKLSPEQLAVRLVQIAEID